MAQTTFSVRMDSEVKKQLDEFCALVGMNTTTAFNMFARAVLRERRLPFDVTTESDPFFVERKLPPPPARIVVKNDAELLAKLEEADAYAESGHHSAPEAVFERLGRKYGLYDKNVG
jgi:DNA-damage-inducible protein J